MGPKALLIVGVFVAGAAGCSNTGSTGGTPGTKDSFTLKGPNLTTTLKQTERQVVKLSLDRGSDFKHTVKLDAVAPKGLKVDFVSKTIAPSDAADVSMTVEAEKDAALGEHKIHVTATPDTGAPSAIDVTVKVEEKK